MIAEPASAKSLYAGYNDFHVITAEQLAPSPDSPGYSIICSEEISKEIDGGSEMLVHTAEEESRVRTSEFCKVGAREA